MTLTELQSQVALGEDSRRQFKQDVTNADALAAEMAAFSNAEGGTLFLGVADDGALTGLDRAGVARLNQLITNAAAHNVRSPLTVQTENIAVFRERVVVVLTVPKGLEKPYFDRNGIIWLKSGADKRRVNSREELRRLFQSVDQFHADELPTGAGLDKLDKLRFRDFLRDVYQLPWPDTPEALLNLLQNMNLATDDGRLNLAGVLLFAERPEWIRPQFIVKAIRYPGNTIHASDYLDTEDLAGPLLKVFKDSMAFVMRNLRKVQAGQGVNAPGVPEIPPTVFEELLVNALVHRDYMVNAPIRLFIFDRRIEIISPGHLPDNLTVAKIRTGNSNIRNPILVSYIAKGILPYRGIGSGIKRALADWPEIEFTDDHEGCLFTATLHRREEVEEENGDEVTVRGAPIGSDSPISAPISAPIAALISAPIASDAPIAALISAPIAADAPIAAPIASPNSAPIAADAPIAAPISAPIASNAPIASPISAPISAPIALDAPIAAPIAAPISAPIASDVPIASPIASPITSDAPIASPISAPIAAEVASVSPNTEQRVMEMIRQDRAISVGQIGKDLELSKRSVLKYIQRLKEQGRLRRVGASRGGHWEVVE